MLNVSIAKSGTEYFVEHLARSVGYIFFPTDLVQLCVHFGDTIYPPQFEFVVLDDPYQCMSILKQGTSFVHDKSEPTRCGLVHLCDPAQSNLMLSLLKIWRHFRYTITLSVDYNGSFLFVGFLPDWVKNTLHFQLGNSKFPTWSTTNQFRDWNKNDSFYVSGKFNMFQIIVQKSVSENFIEIRNIFTSKKLCCRLYQMKWKDYLFIHITTI
ncbi:hypothetical protein RFI_37887 [Reticulomyxa filosa]|uniref:Uncharacterized protein n=1 Tax=Reticulomyxa filosa TaxID=46433 RepID=X6LEN1_RETFI|nr:hypothetical protein RFI_37887 [Reticulomyxa filosa]|eukprot:ETN99586.1 hypothetical protein RFI_37887 [Reticulomyxa filosa]